MRCAELRNSQTKNDPAPAKNLPRTARRDGNHQLRASLFRFNKKPFCVFHGKEDEPAIAFKVLKTEAGIFLEDPRFFKTPYMHHNGWISLRAQGKLDWKEIKELVKASYGLTAL
jgi:predicted DNA-binding protein (MmcQ/YjbR family)